MILIAGLSFFAGTKFSRTKKIRGAMVRTLSSHSVRSPSTMRQKRDLSAFKAPSIEISEVPKMLMRSMTNPNPTPERLTP